MLLVLKKVLKIRKVNVNVVKVEWIVRIKKLMIQSFIEAIGGGDELKDFIVVCFVLLFLYHFSFHLVSDTLFCVFVLRVIRNCLRMLVLIITIKDSSVKNGDEALKDSNLAFF